MLNIETTLFQLFSYYYERIELNYEELWGSAFRNECNSVNLTYHPHQFDTLIRELGS